MKKQFICREDGEEFIIKADNLKQAQQDAALYNGVVIRERKNNETKQRD